MIQQLRCPPQAAGAGEAALSGDDICLSHFDARCAPAAEESVNLANHRGVRGSSKASSLTPSPSVITTTHKAVQQGSRALLGHFKHREHAASYQPPEFLFPRTPFYICTITRTCFDKLITKSRNKSQEAIL